METVGYIVLTYEFYREGKKWVAQCEELGTATFGRSLPEAKRRIRDAVVCHLDTLEDVGEREQFFKKHNIKFHHSKPRINISVRIPTNRDIFIQSYIQPIPAGSNC